jgi:acylphosphatase
MNKNTEGDISKNNQNKIRVHIVANGKVQGVYFRQNTQCVCTRYGVTGWICNLADGSIEIVLEGDRDSVDNVIEWCKVGPPNARVEKFDLRFDRYTGEFQDFKINY